MVNVGVGQQNKIDRGRIERKTLVVSDRGIATALNHAAVDQKSRACSINQEARSGDFASGTQKR
jgi:hypothetical protein